LIAAFTTWLIINAFSKKPSFRFTGIEPGLIIFCIGSVMAIWAASNKRLAVNDFITLTAPILMTIMLVHLLDQKSIKAVLIVIFAIGIAAAYQCGEQFFASNQMLIDQYENNPTQQLSLLGIKPNTLMHMLYEHRLYSKDIRGFFTTSNSAGSFAILALFSALAVLYGKVKKVSENSRTKNIIVITIFSLIALAGLVITQSKGAIAATILSGIAIVCYFSFKDWLYLHKKMVLILLLITISLVTFMTISYGIDHGRLPGGNSMLVRWQYWQGAYKMFTDHLFTGVGGKNFGIFYTQYKPAGAPETVSDPHNFILSLLTQYGLIGSAGLLMTIILPMLIVIFGKKNETANQNLNDKTHSKFGLLVGLLILAAFLFIRPAIFSTIKPLNAAERIFSYIYLFAVTATVFAIAYFIISRFAENITFNNNAIAILFCGLVALLIHNLIDFAIFEPGIWTTMWLIIACILSLNKSQENKRTIILPGSLRKITAIAISATLLFSFSYFAFIPVLNSSARIKKASDTINSAHSYLKIPSAQNLAIVNNLYNKAQGFLTEASEFDPISPEAAEFNARLSIQKYLMEITKDNLALLIAEGNLLEAARRDHFNFKYQETLTDVYDLLAKNSVQQNIWEQNAFASAQKAVGLYPNSGRLRLTLAQKAQSLGKKELALNEYKKAVEIEDCYRKQYKIMYGDRKLYSRLGEENYQFALQQIKKLTETNQPASDN